MRPLGHAKAFDYSARAILARSGIIEVTNAAPEFAEALAAAISAHGAKALIVRQPSANGVRILTEALADGTAASRHHAVLASVRARTDSNARTYVLDHSTSSRLSDIGGCAGLCRSVRIERPEAAAYALSLDGPEDMASAAERVVHALVVPPDDYVLHHDGGWRDVPGPNLLPPLKSVEIPGSPVWLVTGGARGVTADCAVELARRTQGTFLLLGRSELAAWLDWLPHETDLKSLRGLLARNSDRPDVPKKPAEIDRLARRLLAGAEISETLAAMKNAGAKARYLQADIGDAANVRDVLADVQQTEGRITGLVHGAGVLSDGLIEALGTGDFEAVFAPKVNGLETLLSCLDTDALNHIGLFSSASAVFGNSGQANYAAANAWLNNTAEHLSASLPRAQVKSFCWGPWQGGMVDESLARMFTERGIGLITRSEGARIFADMLLGSPKEQVRFVIGDEWGGA